MTLDGPLRELAAIDPREGFRTGRQRLYQRARVLAQTLSTAIPAWVYRMNNLRNGIRLPSGRRPQR